jgi:hypothetical protein
MVLQDYIVCACILWNILQPSAMIILDLAYMSMMLLPQDINLTTTSTNLFLNMPTFFKYVY